MIQRTFFGFGMLHTSDDFNHPMLQYRTADCKQLAARNQPYGVAGVHGSAAAAPPLAFSETGASPITSTSAFSASGMPSPVTAEISSGVFFAARFSRSFC